MRDSTIIYRSFYEAIMEIPEKNQAEVWKAIFEYSLNFNDSELTGLSKTIFTLIKPQLEANVQRYKNSKKKKKKKQNGSEIEATDKLNISETSANENVNENLNVNENNNSVDTGLTSSQIPEVKIPKKKVPRKKKGISVSEDGRKFADWYNEKMKPEAMRPEPKDLLNWGKTFDEVVKKGYTKQQIFQAVTWARSDEFWRTNFQSPVKLMKVNGDGVKYIDVFLDKANKTKPNISDLPVQKMKYNPVVGMIPDND